MRKTIAFRIEEEKNTDTVAFEQFVSNGFGKMFSLPPKTENIRFTDNFNAKDLGDLFISLGNKLKEEKHKITNLKLISMFRENLSDMGKTFEVELQYDIVERESRK